MIIRTVEELYDLPDDAVLLGADRSVTTARVLRFEGCYVVDLGKILPATVLIQPTISQEKFKSVVAKVRDHLDPPGISGAQHLTTKHVERIAELVLQGVGIEITE